MISRRSFLGKAAAGAALATIPGIFPKTVLSAVKEPSDAAAGLSSFAKKGMRGAADDESFWKAVQQSFSVDRSLMHLNNGGVCPAPVVVQEAEKAHLAEFHRSPFYSLQSAVRPQIESVRSQLAECLGCDSEEIAFTRNTSEGMEIVQLGIRLNPGDEILTTSQDYPRMLRTWEQRIKRDGIVLKKIDIPVPLVDAGVLVDRFRSQITPKTRLIMCCHMIDLTGQILPIKEICAEAHANDILVLVDGAQTFAQVPFNLRELGCDFFATSLHKWMMGPQGTGLLFVRKNLIPSIWPLMSASADLSADIRKFEDIGTTPPSRILSLGEAIAFHHQIGAARKEKRLSYLRDFWLNQLLRFDRIVLKTNTKTAASLATVDVEGIDPVALRDFLWEIHRIRVRPIRTDQVTGIRASASVYTSKYELDRFINTMENVIRYGIPKTS